MKLTAEFELNYVEDDLDRLVLDKVAEKAAQKICNVGGDLQERADKIITERVTAAVNSLLEQDFYPKGYNYDGQPKGEPCSLWEYARKRLEGWLVEVPRDRSRHNKSTRLQDIVDRAIDFKLEREIEAVTKKTREEIKAAVRTKVGDDIAKAILAAHGFE